jgi:glycosyltransferase involved in cell wall biosynthesis
LFKLQYKYFVNKYFPDQFKILWLFYNRLYPILDNAEHDFIVYDYQDNFDYLPDGTWSSLDAEFNELLIKRSNFIICTGKVMYERAKKLNKHSVYVPNGNNFNVLSILHEKKSGNELFGSNRKIIGYLGGIRKWLDFELLETILNTFPDSLLVSIGLVYRDAKNEFFRLKTHSNFFWINYMELERLPVYLNNFDVGIIPFKLNKFMEGVFPNKFFEYMASGVPIVTTALPELEKYSENIGYAKNHDEFIKYLSIFLNGNEKVDINEYKKMAFLNSWIVRAEEINFQMKKVLKNE